MYMEQEENGTFLCKWVIEKFAFALDDEELSSPEFLIPDPDGDENIPSRLHIVTKEGFLLNGFHCLLKMQSEDVEKIIHFKTFILAGGGSYRLISTNIIPGCCLYKMATGFVDGRDIMSLLNGNTLTICCRIWSTGRLGMFKPLQCLLRTRIGTQKQTFRMKVQKGKHKNLFIENGEYTSDNDLFQVPFKVYYFWSADSGSGGQKLHIQIQKLRVSKQQVACMVYVLDSTGNPVLSQEDKFCFSKRQIFDIPPFISEKWLSDNGDKCLVNDTLNLWVEIEMTTGETSDEVEKIYFGESSTSLADGIDYEVGGNRGSSTAANPLASGLLSLYQEQRFCDVTIETGISSYGAHKAVLCAQSPVFAAMFERDMEEKRTGVVKIRNLADDTVRHMLLYMYANTMEYLEWESVLHLYLAAEQYGILSLKRKCKDALNAKLSVVNVTKVLVLTDLHNDDDWKSHVYRFILERDADVISSDEWKDFVQDHTKLAADAMYQVYLLKIRK